MSCVGSTPIRTHLKYKHWIWLISERLFERCAAPLVFVGALLTLALLAATGAKPVSASTRDAKIEGARLFKERGCEFCHGVDGIGTERAPSLEHVGKRKKKQEIEHQIRFGDNVMPPFGDALQPDEIKTLVEYLSSRR